MIGRNGSTAIVRNNGLDYSTRDIVALGLWLAVFAGMLFLDTHGQSKLMTAGLVLQLTGAYSTFVLCGKRRYGPFVHALPYVFALTGAMLLGLAPDFRHAFAASLVFLAVTATMHWSTVRAMRKNSPDTEKTADVI
jgi:hypothetical protein